VPYQWVKLLHVASAIGFVAVHGASIAVLYIARKERERKRLLAVLDFSGRTATAMYVSLGAIVTTGLWLAFLRTSLFSERWYWLAIVVLAATSVAMLAVAKPFTARIRAACAMRPSGIPRKSDEELAEIVGSSRVHVISLIGVIGLVSILYLMVIKPDLGSDSGRVAAPTVTTSVVSTTTASGTTVTGAATTVVTTTLPSGGDEALLALGREVYEVTAGGVGCASCHGSQGEGSAVAPRIAGRSKAVIEGALGWVAEMADIELTPQELDAVSRYVRQLDS